MRSRPQLSPVLALLLAAAGLGLTAPPAAAWSPAAQQEIAHEAAQLAPPDLARQIERHQRRLADGAVAPFRDRDPLRHAANPDGSGVLDRVIEEEVERTIQAIVSYRPFADIVHQLGVVSHYVADANNPLATSAEDPEEGRYFADYLGYMESTLPRLRLLFYGLFPDLEARPSVAPLLQRTLRRSRSLYPLVGNEYRRVGFTPGRRSFDDRSTAFGVAALSFNHAVNDVALVMRYIWLRAGGYDPRSGLPKIGERTLLLPRAGQLPPQGQAGR